MVACSRIVNAKLQRIAALTHHIVDSSQRYRPIGGTILAIHALSISDYLSPFISPIRSFLFLSVNVEK